jgi:hypothetical protein
LFFVRVGEFLRDRFVLLKSRAKRFNYFSTAEYSEYAEILEFVFPFSAYSAVPQFGSGCARSRVRSSDFHLAAAAGNAPALPVSETGVQTSTLSGKNGRSGRFCPSDFRV